MTKRVTLVSITTYVEGRFIVKDQEGKRFQCAFIDKDRDWDKLYDCLTHTFSLEFVGNWVEGDNHLWYVQL